ncbi:MAG: hypothetical protein ACR2MD_12635 [Aridibacter sp.]
MKWYVVWFLFAQLPKEGKKFVMCESSQVLFRSKTANEAYDKALIWANEQEKDNNFKFVGIEHMSDLLDEEIVDGTEIDGSFFKKKNIWEQRNEIIPDKNAIKAIMWEENQDTPVGELMTDNQKKKMREIFEE